MRLDEVVDVCVRCGGIHSTGFGDDVVQRRVDVLGHSLRVTTDIDVCAGLKPVEELRRLLHHAVLHIGFRVAIGTVAGAALGTSTVTSFIESASGVEQGGRTGLTGLVVAALFLLALFFSPLIAMVGSYPPITAPALVIVGAMMSQNVGKIDWKDYTESIPAFLTMIGIPLSYSIADGLALGFISYPIVKFLSGRGHEAGPDRGRRALRYGLPGEGPCAWRLAGVDAGDQPLQDLRRHVAGEFCVDPHRMQGRGPYAARLVPAIELDGEKDVGRLRTSIGNHGVVGRPLKIGIVEVDVSPPMTRGGHIDQPSALANQRGNPVHENKVAEVIGTELCLKAVHGMAKRGCHHSGIGNDHVETLPARQEFVGAGADALQTGQIERDQLEAATIRRGVLLHLRGRGRGFLKVPHCSCHLRTVGRKSPRRLNADARGHAGDENAFSVQIDPRQNLVGS